MDMLFSLRSRHCYSRLERERERESSGGESSSRGSALTSNNNNKTTHGCRTFYCSSPFYFLRGKIMNLESPLIIILIPTRRTTDQERGIGVGQIKSAGNDPPWFNLESWVRDGRTDGRTDMRGEWWEGAAGRWPSPSTSIEVLSYFAGIPYDTPEKEKKICSKQSEVAFTSSIMVHNIHDHDRWWWTKQHLVVRTRLCI